MQKRLWIFQFKSDISRRGAEHASWYVGWYDAKGKRRSESCGPGEGGRNRALRRCRQIQSELDIGVHRSKSKKRWDDFVGEYESRLLSNLAMKSKCEAKQSLKNFRRVMKPGYLENIKTQTIDEFVAKRRHEKGRKPKSLVSPATINKDLRHLKAALRVARDWDYISELPKIRMLREPKKIPRFVSVEHFAVIYSKASDLARLPDTCGHSYCPNDWWKALIVTAYMTGLRIHEILALKWSNVSLRDRQALTLADDNKGKRDDKLALHPVVVEHLQALQGPSEFVFQWPHDPRTLWEEFGRIQREAGIHLHCSGKHEHTPSCHVYGFHDFRRAFATVNAPRMKPEVLQKVMRHKSYQTTLGYVNLANQVEESVLAMPIPDVLKK
jgi:integrase